MQNQPKTFTVSVCIRVSVHVLQWEDVSTSANQRLKLLTPCKHIFLWFWIIFALQQGIPLIFFCQWLYDCFLNQLFVSSIKSLNFWERPITNPHSSRWRFKMSFCAKPTTQKSTVVADMHLLITVEKGMSKLHFKNMEPILFVANFALNIN